MTEQEIKCQICGAPTGLTDDDMESCLPVCSEKCSNILIKTIKQS